MHYVCLVYSQENAFDTLTAPEQKALDADSLAYDRELERKGHMVLAHALHSEKKSRIVRRRQNKTMVLDGPFTESKEQLVGFIVIDAETMDEAEAIGAGIPMARIGTVVVRATMNFDA